MLASSWSRTGWLLAGRKECVSLFVIELISWCVHLAINLFPAVRETSQMCFARTCSDTPTRLPNKQGIDRSFRESNIFSITRTDKSGHSLSFLVIKTEKSPAAVVHIEKRNDCDERQVGSSIFFQWSPTSRKSVDSSFLLSWSVASRKRERKCFRCVLSKDVEY